MGNKNIKANVITKFSSFTHSIYRKKYSSEISLLYLYAYI